LRRQDLVIGPWGARFLGRRFACALGRGGIGAKRAEGDGVTPEGAHAIERVLFRPDRVRVRGPLRAQPIGLRDGWSDDPADPCYNRRVVRPRGFSHEALRRADGMYDVLAVLDWNRNPVVSGRGSAIFLHVWRGPRKPTAGCVAFRRRDLVWIIERWTRGARAVVRR
jgi:L,D-peptidoglycan transpeptidase YkuD (ErfK/YbiS/YcfS/YnhG family)